ncbi:MAG: ABC transporter ATP-binding protein/permease [Chitinophagaceae bacterium]|nr:ABC transporter ATP-binding protein/permease [Chitinophagaceae bacterium]
MSKEEKKKIFNTQLLKRVFVFAKPYAGRFYLSVALALVLAVFSPLRPLMINYTLKKVNAAGEPVALVLQFLLYITLIQIVFLFIETATKFLFTYITSWLGHKVVKDIRVEVFQKILHLNLRQFDKTPIGTLTTRTINDIEAINDIFAEGFIPIIADLLSVIAILAAMLYTDWRLTLICLIPFPFLIVATYLFKESVNKSFIAVRNAIASLNAFVQEHISGMQIIQAFTAEKREMKKFDAINQRHRNANIDAIFAYSVFFPVVEIILAVSMGLLVWFAAKDALHVDAIQATAISGNIVAFALLLSMLFRPLRVIADKFNVLQMGMVAAERVMLVMDNQDELNDQPGARDMQIKGQIDFKHVGFSYKEGIPVLKDVNFSVLQGKTLAIVGHTGSGKSTIVHLINRLYQHQEGEILIDGQAIEKLTLHTLRSQIAVVLQDVFLFSGSILDNVTLRDPAIPFDKVKEAAKMIGIHDFIEQLPGGYQYNVQERGATLSTGQRQLLSFLRALLFNPAILILDEATSSVDSNTEGLIQKAIDVLTNGRTSIVIAHRLSTIRKAHKIIVLEGGKLIEEGTHKSLLAQQGSYSKMIAAQLKKDGD